MPSLTQAHQASASGLLQPSPSHWLPSGRRSLQCGLLAALLWSLADMLLVGFIAEPAAAPLFTQQLHGQLNAELAVLMLDGSPQRLLWGVVFATFSVLFYVLALPGLAEQLPSNRWGRVTLWALLAGYVLSPVGHAGFGYLGMLAQSIQHSAALGMDTAALAPQVALFNTFTTWLHLHWLASVSASALGWLLVVLLTLSGRTRWPRTMLIANPLLLAPALGLFCAQWPDSQLAVYIGCASINLAQLVFFVCALHAFKKCS